MRGIKDSQIEPKEQLPWIEDYLRAFYILSAGRTYSLGGMGGVIVQHLSLKEISSYFEIYEITELQEKHEYLSVIQALDDTFVTYQNKKLNKK